MAEKEELQNLSVFNVFAESQETYEEAKQKSNEESSKRASYLRFDKDGKYAIRILPLAPVIGADGKPQPMERKGYEYPIRSHFFKIKGKEKDKKGKIKEVYASVCNAKYAYPDLPSDLVDMYVKVACEKYADDENLCKAIKKNSFEHGLKWDSGRCMYVIDLDNPANGIQILQLSYSQYKELEERKLDLWGELNSDGDKVPCPISSIKHGYKVNVTRKTDGKTSYMFNISTAKGPVELSEDTLNKLLTMPRLPEVIYRYTKYHLEATIAFLNQYDEEHQIEVMKSDEIKECIEQIKLVLPADDQSHFSFDSKSSENNDTEDIDNLDALWDRFDKLADEGLEDDSEEGQDLRASIREFIETNDLSSQIKVTHRKTNQDLLNAIEKALSEKEDGEDDEEEEEAPAKPVKSSKTSKHVKKEEPDEEEEEEESEEAPAEEPDEEEEEEAPAEDPREHNDDTNEPAARRVRRGARPARRR